MVCAVGGRAERVTAMGDGALSDNLASGRA